MIIRNNYPIRIEMALSICSKFTMTTRTMYEIGHDE